MTAAQLDCKFFKNIEKGDIALCERIQYAIIVLGKTKVGKTSSCHYLNNETLCGENKGGQEVYKLSNSNSRNRNARIGQNPSSQTEIPNFFKPQILGVPKHMTVKLIDFPGYSDSFGCHRILSNAFFYYRVFSKVANMKFVITFDRNFLSGTANQFFQTLKQFLTSFKNYNEIKQKIISASSFLFTKCEDSKQIITNIQQKLKVICNHIPTTQQDEIKKRLIEFIQKMIQNDSIFTIKKAKIGVKTTTNQLLSDIFHKTKFWQRDQSKTLKNLVDMTNVSFTARQDILSKINSNKKFKQGYKSLCDYQKTRAQKILGSTTQCQGSLVNIINTIVQDTMGELNQRNFLRSMKLLIDSQYNFEDFKDQRKLLQKENFDQKGKKQANSNELGIYWINKFKVVKFIIDIAKDMSQLDQTDRSVQQLDFMQEKYSSIIRKLNLIRYQKENSIQIIFKYGYLFFRLYEEAKVFTLIFLKDNQGDQFDSNKSEMDKSFEEFFDIFRYSRDVIPQLNNAFEDINAAKQKFLLEKDLNIFEKDICEKTVEFFADVNSNQLEFQLKQVKLIVFYAKKVQEDCDKKINFQKLLSLLFKARITVENILNNNQQQVETIKQNQEILIELTNKMGFFLMRIKKYRLARQVYHSVNNIHKAIQVFRQHIKNSINKVPLLIDLAQYASKHCRTDVSMSAYQEAYAQTNQNQKRIQIADAILHQNITLEGSQIEVQKAYHVYITNMMNRRFYEPFDQTMIEALNEIWESKLKMSKELQFQK